MRLARARELPRAGLRAPKTFGRVQAGAIVTALAVLSASGALGIAPTFGEVIVVEGRVERVVGDTVRVDVGANDGLLVGDVLEVERVGRRRALVRVDRVLADVAICIAIDVAEGIEVGDDVRFSYDESAGDPASDAGKAATDARARAAAVGDDDGPAPPAPATQRTVSSAGPGQPAPPLGPEEVLRLLEAAPRQLRSSTATSDDKDGTEGTRTRRPGDKPGRRQPPHAREAPRTKSSGTPVRPAPRANVVSGSIRVAYDALIDRSDDTEGFTHHGPRVGGALRVSRIGGANLTLRLRGNARWILGEDRADRTGSDLAAPRVFLYEASADWIGEHTPVRVTAGRVGLYEAASVGAVDGGRLAVRVGPVEVGGFGGLDPRPDLDDRGRTKIGGYVHTQTQPGSNLAYDGSLAYVRTTTREGDVDRQLVAVDQRLRLRPWLSLFGRLELDVYEGTENLLERDALELTDAYASLRVTPSPQLDLGVSFDRRRPFFGTEALEDLGPDTLPLLPTDPLTTVRVDAAYRTTDAYWVRAALGVLRGGSDRTTASAALGGERILGTEARARLQLRGWRDDRITGGSMRMAAGHPVSPVRGLDVDLAYEVSVDRLRETDDEYRRHAFEAELLWAVRRPVSTRLAARYWTGDDIDSVEVGWDVIWRF